MSGSKDTTSICVKVFTRVQYWFHCRSTIKKWSNVDSLQSIELSLVGQCVFTCSRLSSLWAERWGWLLYLSLCPPAPLTLWVKAEREKKRKLHEPVVLPLQINFLTKGGKHKTTALQWFYHAYDNWCAECVCYITHWLDSQPWSYLARCVRDSVTFLPV